MEDAHIGEHCAGCGTRSYCPVQCDQLCKQWFCEDHQSGHNCKDHVSAELWTAHCREKDEHDKTLRRATKARKKSRTTCRVPRCKTKLTEFNTFSCSHCPVRTCMGHRFHHTDTCAAAHAVLTAERMAAETKRADEDMLHTIKIYHGCIMAVKHLTRTVTEKQQVIVAKYQENYRVGSKRRDIEYYKGVIERYERSIEEHKEEIEAKTTSLATTIKTLGNVKAAIERFNKMLEVLKGADPVDEEKVAAIQKNMQVLESSISRKATEASAHVTDIKELNDRIKQCSESIAGHKETVARMETDMEKLIQESKREHEQKVKEAEHIVTQTPSAVTFLRGVIMTLAPSDFTIESIPSIDFHSVDRCRPARALNPFKRREMFEKFATLVDPVCQRLVQTYFS